MSWLTKTSLHNRSIVVLAALAVVLLGLFGITSLKQELIPDLTFPYLTVVTVAPGSSASDVERNVTTPVEQAIKTTSDVKEFVSYSNEGLSILTIEYEFGTDIDAKEAEVQQALSGVQQALPQGAMAPEVAALNFNAMPVVQLAVTSDLPPQQIAALLQSKVVPRLQAIPDVQAVTLSGLSQEQLQIRLDPAEVLRFGVSPESVMTAVQQANLTSGAGSVTAGSLVYPVTVTARAATVAAFEDLVITPTSAATSASASAAAEAPETVTLGEIAEVSVAPGPADRGHAHERRGVDRHLGEQVGQRQHRRHRQRGRRRAAGDRERARGSGADHDRPRPVGLHRREHHLAVA